MPNLCVSCTFNPPTITLLGSTLREDTIRSLEKRLPLTTSTALTPGKETPHFAFASNPDHWRMELQQHFCSEVHKSSMYLAIIQSLEEEGWRVRASNSVVNPANGKETCKMFFTRA